MKTLHIGKYYPPHFGGIEKVNFDLVEGLNKSGTITDILCFNNKFKTVIENKGYSIFRMSRLFEINSMPISISYYFKLLSIINNYDIVHLHLPNPLAAIFLLFTDFKGNIVLHWHSDIIKQKFFKKIYLPFDNYLKSKAKSIIVTSNNYLNNSKDLKDYKEKCKVIPLGIDNSEFDTDNSFYNNLKNKFKGKKIIFSLGRLTYYKGFDHLINAALELDDSTVIIIGGTGELYSDLKNKIIDNNLQSKVIIAGKISHKHLHSYFKLADIFCLPSIFKSEAFGVVLIEAMSFGCPQVVFNIKGSGVPWVVENNRTGLVIEKIDSKLLGMNLKRLLSDVDLLENFSKQSIKRYNKFFKKQEMIARTLELYSKL